jgi:type VI secretion system secreted protein Hcp
MPIPAYMTIEGATQGDITAGAMSETSVGISFQEDHEDEILVQAFSHNIVIPRDPQSGQPTGQRIHQPMKITKVFDQASPLLFQALTTGERLTSVEIKWYRNTAEGALEHYFTVELEDAIIVDIVAFMPNCLDPSQAHFTHMEEVSFTYSKITWTHEAAGAMGSDNWRAAGGG